MNGNKEKKKESSIEGVYKKFPALKNLGEVTLKADPSYTTEKTGKGDIEYFSPTQDTVSYKNFTYNVPHPKMGTHGIVYNPKTNDEQDIALDMLHGMISVDPSYRTYWKGFANSILKSNFRWDMERDWEDEEDKNDGKQQFTKNWIDGQLRALLFEGSKKDFERANYWKGQKALYFTNDNIYESFSKLKKYLLTDPDK